MKLILVVLALILVGCGNSSDNGGTSPQSGNSATCNTVSDKGLCYEWVSESPVDSAKSWCDSVGGTYAAGQVCPTANRIGECTVTLSSTRKNYTYAYAPLFSQPVAQTTCQNIGGVYTPL